MSSSLDISVVADDRHRRWTMKRRLMTLLISIPLMWVASILVADAAGAVVPPLLAKTPEDGASGTGAGRLKGVEGIAADPRLPGHVYVADAENARVDEFTPWGDFVKAWGWGVVDGQAKLESCTLGTGCREGLRGDGTGEFSYPEALVVDGAGDIYVIEAENHRVQKFNPASGVESDEVEFSLMFGLDVNKTKVNEVGASQAERDVCTGSSGDICQAGGVGVGPGQFGGAKFGYRNRIAACPAVGTVAVGERERIQLFGPSGGFKEEIKMPAGENLEAITADAECNFYASVTGEGGVRKLGASGPSAKFLLPLFSPEAPKEQTLEVAVDGNGDLYAVNNAEGKQRVLEYDQAGKCLDCGSAGEREVEKGELVGKSGFDRSSDTTIEGIAASSACEADDVYTTHYSLQQSFIKVFGEPPNVLLCPSPPVAPEVETQYALTVETDGAVIRADINPRFWDDTSYHVEYGTTPCSKGGCTSTAEASLGGGVVGTPQTSHSVLLKNLTPGTAYYYRFVARSSGGGPVYGIDPDGHEGPEGATFEKGLEGTFTTRRLPGAEDCSANETLRVGVSASLPDCRAYEMVSPLDKDNSDVIVLQELSSNLPAVLNESSVSGDRFAYGSSRPFGDAAAAPYTTQYIAGRGPTGWVSHGITPPHGEPIVSAVAANLDTEFKAFSPDLCQAWLVPFNEPLLAPGAIAGHRNLYRRTDNDCGGPGYEALTTSAGFAPPSEIPGQVELQGVSGDGSEAIYVASGALTEDTPILGAGRPQLYARSEGRSVFVCVLPNGEASTGLCSAGGRATTDGLLSDGRYINVRNAISRDGRRVFWSASSDRIYVRENPVGEGPECADEASPCTVAVSQAAEEEAGSSGSQFWTAAEDGSKALFTTGTPAKLYEFRLADRSTHLIAGKVLGLLGASGDASRSYLASEEALGGMNAEGKSATAGKNNFYFYEAGSFHFIGTSVNEGNHSPFSATPIEHTSRVSADGLHAVFMSAASLTGYDNTDAVSGEADSEVFVYDASANGGAGRLDCVSCNPTGARPRGMFTSEIGSKVSGGAKLWTAGLIPTFENVLYAPRVLSDSGGRVFFDSYDALVPADTNGTEDVYEWEVPGTGNCKESSSSYSPSDGGCVDLISSGKSPLESKFADASTSGDDVFFTTLASLVPQDPGLVDMYDARVDGGFPTPPPTPASCEGEACQSPAVGLTDMTPGTLSFSGAGNLLGQPMGQINAKSKTVALSRAQKLARALKACAKKPKRKRAACRSRARKQYAPATKARKANNTGRAPR
jgi:hypothetical protein